jgi:DNA polymerase I-like protein with 3'-5' exonuclease and polymerase domains
MCIGYRLGADAGVLWFEYEPGAPVGNSVHALRTLIERAGVVVAFNAKFELHWLRRFGILVDKPIWDTQLYEFIVSGQNPAMPSLEGVCKKYSLGEKYTEIEELWAMNLDARLIARETYVNRVTSDVELTLRLYAFQQEDQRKRSSQFINLIQLEMLDLRALEEMEYNGQLYNKNKAIDLATECRTESKTLSTNLDALVPNAPINWNSTLHKSAVLYGGLIEWSEREEIGQYKTGTKAGTPRYRIIDKSQTLERLCTPPEGSNLDREGYYSTAEPILRAISTGGRGKQIISLLLRRQELEKLIGTYYSGIPELIEEMGWTDNIVHGQFNQTVAVTGRLSSSKPNLQNQPELSKRLFITRFDDNSSR